MYCLRRFSNKTKINIQTYYCFDKDMNINNNTQHIPNVFKSYGLKPVKNYDQADLLFTSMHDHFFKLVNIEHVHKCKYIYGLRCVNLFASKSTLPMIAPRRILPKTWILHKKTQKDDLLKHFKNDKPTKHLLLKSNVQRQTGLKIVTHKNDILHHEKYVVCQEILENPFLVNNRKIDIRIYVVIVCDQYKANMFIFNDGFIYYTKNEYTNDNDYTKDNEYTNDNDYTKNEYTNDNNKIDKDSIISSGYIDRKIYEENPLTLQNLYVYVGKSKEEKLKSSIRECFHVVFHSYYPYLKKNDINDGVNRFIILGADVSPDQDLNVKLLEMNKGPDLKAKDDRDRAVKEKLVHECINLLKTPDDSNHFFTKII
uniref:Uncharacterized protein n=1 Tax=viral metagenome TaxID=1070528 RepID=A0A6C0CVJ1_9ZZZZ